MILDTNVWWRYLTAGRMAKEKPGSYVATAAKKLRQGRIYLDYLRNDPAATAVAPLSPRARPGAPVSMPLDWSEVTGRLNPASYTIRTVPHLLAKADAWAGYEEEARSLKPALRRLG